MSNPFNNLKSLILSLESDFDKWHNHQNSAAGTRLRKGLQIIKQHASTIRQEVNEFKDNRNANREGVVIRTSKIEQGGSENRFYQFETNAFKSVVGTISYNGQTIHTRFTDKQAVNICAKMADSYARNIALKFQQFTNYTQGGIYRYQLHYFANKALALYGGPVLTFLSGLRPLKFSNVSAVALKRFIPASSFQAREVDFPTLTFQTLNGNEFTLAFHLTQKAERHRKPVQIFRNRVKVGSIDSKGIAFDAQNRVMNKTLAVRPTLLLFFDYLKSSKNPAFYSGVETGSCFVCGRPLTDPRSIRYGIGPTCLNNAM